MRRITDSGSSAEPFRISASVAGRTLTTVQDSLSAMPASAWFASSTTLSSVRSVTVKIRLASSPPAAPSKRIPTSRTSGKRLRGSTLRRLSSQSPKASSGSRRTSTRSLTCFPSRAASAAAKMFPSPPCRYCRGSPERWISLPQMSDSSTSSETTVFFAMIKCSGRRGARRRSTQRSDEVQHLGGMPAGLDAVERVPDRALLVDDESGARDARFPRPVGFLLVHHAVFPAHLALGGREKPEKKKVRIPENG